MTRRSTFPFSGLLLSLLAVLLIVPFLGTAANADPSDPADPAASATPATDPLATPQEVAEEALETVEELLEPTPAAVGAPTEGPDLTLALRDLAASRLDLPKDKQDDAARLLARPTDGIGSTDPNSSECFQNDGPPCYRTAESTPLCTGDICVHWVNGTDRNRPNGENNGATGAWPGTNPAFPDYVEYVADVFSRVAFRYEEAGYDRPAGDGTTGGGGLDKVDIYIAELGNQGVYGYCATDRVVTGHVSAPAYCVVDNDYSPTQYPGRVTPGQNLQVTAAHEYFHAVQFAYDFNEDGWFYEATATWVEDELFDTINDNRQFLSFGPLGLPAQSLDKWSGLSQYGAWIFFRFLTERYPTKTGVLPNIVRTMIERSGDGEYSVQAMNNTLAAQGASLARLFARFTVENRQPQRFYEEGAAYRAAPAQGTYRLTSTAPTQSLSFKLHHLSAKTHRFVPKVTGRWTLRIKVNVNSPGAGGAVMVTYKPPGKPSGIKIVPLSQYGMAHVAFPFGSRVDWIDVTAINASTRFAQCGTPGRDFTSTCQGVPVDDGVPQSVSVRAVRG